ncbi:MAG TPA: NAD(P)/FAD-dependent oxidoreductase [Thermoanaerobaculia bacterium]|nr:NAD(P)/FAD-dependent oxidoreductase [Thermoanaerobaculia bacterium]
MTRRYDAIVAGGGPAGSTAALRLARSGLSVLLAERTRFPRFHVGESLLPRNFQLFRELGLEAGIAALPHHRKVGGEFAFGHETASLRFRFADGLLGDVEAETINVERAPFDAWLLDEAVAAGAEVAQGTAVKEILQLDAGGAAVRLDTGDEVEAPVLLDASGQSTLVGKHLGTRQGHPDHRKVAFFGHARGVQRLPGEEAGHPCIVMMADAWFWLIALDEERTSVGLVMDADHARRTGRELGIPPQRMLAWGIARCPFVAGRTAGATLPAENHVGADFSYHCRPYAGPGYFLLGDAATFLDPIFSTGICLAMVGASRAADDVLALRAGADPAAVHRRYARFVDGSSDVFFRLVRRYYQQPFRELMMQGEGPLAIHRAIYSVLAGHVFPRPPLGLRWRVRLMEALTEVQRRVPLVPRRELHSLHPPHADAAGPAGDLPPREAADAAGTTPRATR